MASLEAKYGFFININKLRTSPQVVVDALLQYRRKVRAIQNDQRLSEQAKGNDTEAARREALLTLAELDGGARTAIETLQGKIKSSLTEKLEPQEALAIEMRRGRAWERAKALLESGRVQPLAMIQRASDEGDRDMLSALAGEMPTWLEVKDYEADFIKLAKSEIRKAERPLLDERGQMARDIEDEVTKGAPQLQAAINMARYELEDSFEARPPVTIIPAWNHKEVLRVEESK